MTDVELLEAHELEPPPTVKLFRRMGLAEVPLTIEEARWEGKGKGTISS